MSNTVQSPSHFSFQSLDLVSELHSIVLLVFMMVKMCLFSVIWVLYNLLYTYSLYSSHQSAGTIAIPLYEWMLRCVRYLPKVTELTGGMMGLQSRAASFQSSHYLHCLVGAGQTGQTAFKTSPNQAWLFSSPPANSTICTGTQMEISEHFVLQNSSLQVIYYPHVTKAP